jgi:pyruvate kinase
MATLGPASWSLAAALLEAGASSLRINASHVSPDGLQATVSQIRTLSPETRVAVDLQGAKMRLGEFVERPVQVGERVVFTLSAEGAVHLPHPEMFTAAVRGDTLGCDDDRLRFRILSVGAGAIEAVALTGGILRPRKGVNVMEHPIDLTDLSDSDMKAIRATSNTGRVAYAFSFMKDGSEAEWIRRRAPGFPVIAKVERAEATSAVDRIAGAVDELWICRGDLAAQLGHIPMARWVSGFHPASAGCPVLMAGQVLQHMTEFSEPTRAEVCNLYDLVSRGYSGFVLSDETAIGFDPVGTVRTLRSLLAEACG